MFKYIHLAFSLTAPLLLSASTLSTEHSQLEKPALLKILIQAEQDKALLEAKGRYLIYDLDSAREIGSGSSSKLAYVVPSQQGIYWHELLPGIKHIKVVPGDSQSSLLVNGIEYKGSIEIHESGGKLNIVSLIDVERYLKATLAFQIPTQLDEEVLEALAIIARTEAYSALNHKSQLYYDIDGRNIPYHGNGLSLQNAAVDQAIQRTKNVILTYHNEPFPATWTANSAGKTVDYATIFRRNIASPKGVETPLAAQKRLESAWSFAITKSDLANLLQAETIRAVDLYQDPTSSKVYALRMQTESSYTDINFFKLQQLLGKQRLRSNDFTVKLHGNQIIFTGFGEGHGVGLCLLSAIAMAEQGDSTQKILCAFFPGSQIQARRVK